MPMIERLGNIVTPGAGAASIVRGVLSRRKAYPESPLHEVARSRGPRVRFSSSVAGARGVECAQGARHRSAVCADCVRSMRSRANGGRLRRA